MFNKILIICFKVLVVILSCYLSLACLIYFLKPKKIDFAIPNNYGEKLARLSLRPIMDIGFDQRISQQWDWKEFKIENYIEKENDGILLKIGNQTEKTYQNFMNFTWWDLSNPEKSVILQPAKLSSDTKWMLVRCVQSNNVLYCQKNNILNSGPIKTSIYKTEQIYVGIDTQGNYLKLNALQVINANQRLDVLFV